MLASGNRSNKAEVRNPLLALPSVRIIDDLGDDAREALRAILLDIRVDARERAEACWQRHKSPMAVYWKVVSVYAGHIARLLRRTEVSTRQAQRSRSATYGH